jgi:hypothetical protein
MSPKLNQIAAGQHIEDLRRAAERARRARPQSEGAPAVRGYRRLTREWRRRAARRRSGVVTRTHP